MSDPTPQWRTMHEAPRQDGEGKPVPIKLFLPGVKYKLDESNRPADIEHGECIGIWDAALSHWVDRDTSHKVYPSQWQPL